MALTSIGRVQPEFAHQAARRLYSLAIRASKFREQAELLTETKYTIAEVRPFVQQASVHLSYIEDGLLQGVEDWRLVHPDDIRDITEEGIDSE